MLHKVCYRKKMINVIKVTNVLQTILTRLEFLNLIKLGAF